ncbi:coiled-coil domain-containing protein 57 [Latimeria chalumnae]|uniref:coiled-coil domain-containing protein 57 n=1 Tax=Latimeria chalumnae TaxID=7897 RepID=UPI00313ECD78
MSNKYEFSIKDCDPEMQQVEGSIEELLAQKEQEWKELQTHRIQMLETALRETGSQLQEQREQFSRLKEDFKYNLQVLQERDRELERYDAMFARLRTVESAKQAEVSDLKIQIDKLQQAVTTEMRKREELQQQYRQRLKEHQLDLERVRNLKDSEIDRHQEDYGNLKWELERRIQEVEGELALQKQELLAEFDSEMRRREREFSLRVDEMSSTVLSSELKVKLLTKELEVLREAGVRAAESLQTAETTNQELEKQLKRREWEIKDVSAMKEAQIKDLEEKLQVLELRWKKEEEIFQRKHQDLDRFARERDAVLAAAKTAHGEQVRELENQIRELQISKETLEMERRRLEWNHADSLREKDEMVVKLHEELGRVKTGWDTHITQVSKETVAKDLQVQSLQEQEVKLKAEVARLKEDVERYKQQLSLAVEREHGLEQARVQAELDWQQRCEDAERNYYLKSEGLIQGLSKARDQARAELREKERELQEMETVVRTLTLERDGAMASLRKHRILPEKEAQVSRHENEEHLQSDFPSDEIRKLQQQNTGLRAVIVEMRRDMEAVLSEQIPANPSKGKSPDAAKPISAFGDRVNDVSELVTHEYVCSLEEEVRELKQKCRQLEQRLEEALKSPSKSAAPPSGLPLSADNAYLQNHIRTLNETIGGLRAEKVSTAAALKKHEARVAHMDAMMVQLTQQVRQKQVEIEQLQYELTKQKQQSDSEILRLQERTVGLELQLTEARKEAEEYFKGNLQQNLAAVALGNEVSALKLDLASRHSPVIVEQSEAVKQLQEEILHLQQQLHGAGSGDGPFRHPGSSIQALQAKLKQAVRQISQLSREKQQLIAMGNQLRAELIRAGLDAPLAGQQRLDAPRLVVPVTPWSDLGTVSAKGLAMEAQSRLSALEQLQYQLTSQEHGCPSHQFEFSQEFKLKRVVVDA